MVEARCVHARVPLRVHVSVCVCTCVHVHCVCVRGRHVHTSHEGPHAPRCSSEAKHPVSAQSADVGHSPNECGSPQATALLTTAPSGSLNSSQNLAKWLS